MNNKWGQPLTKDTLVEKKDDLPNTYKASDVKRKK